MRNTSFEATQLDLLASQPVCDMARLLHLEHGHEQDRLLQVEAQGRQDVAARVANQKEIRNLEIEFAARTREDLGLNRLPRETTQPGAGDKR